MRRFCRGALVVLLAWGLAGLSVAPAGAQSKGRSATTTGGPGNLPDEDAGWRFSVGLGPGILPKYAGAKDYRLLPALRATAEYGGYSASLFGLGARADIFAPEDIEIGPVLNFQFGRDDDEIAGLPGYEDAFFLGLYAAVNFDAVLAPRDTLRLEGIFQQNITDTGDGSTYGVSIGYGMPLSQSLYANLTLGADFNDKETMQRDYGVPASSAASSGLTAYAPGGGLEGVSATVFLGYRFTPEWGLFAVGSGKRLLGEAGDSPIVNQGSENQYFGGFGITYSF